MYEHNSIYFTVSVCSELVQRGMGDFTSSVCTIFYISYSSRNWVLYYVYTSGTGTLFFLCFMKALKIYLGIVATLLCIAIGFGVYVWYTIQKLNSQTYLSPEILIVEEKQDVLLEQQQVEDTATQEPVVTAPSSDVITVKMSDLSESQQKALKGLGYTQDSFTVTPVMARCAEDGVGKVRFGEILGGSAPSPLESFKLFGCFDGE